VRLWLGFDFSYFYDGNFVAMAYVMQGLEL